MGQHTMRSRDLSVGKLPGCEPGAAHSPRTERYHARHGAMVSELRAEAPRLADRMVGRARARRHPRRAPAQPARM